MLTLLIDQTFVKSFGLGMQFHDVGFNLIHGILDSLLLLTRQLDILFCVVERFLQTHQLGGYFLFFCSQLSMEDVKRCFYFAYHSWLGSQFLCQLFFLPDFCSNSCKLVDQQCISLSFLIKSFLGDLNCWVSFLHHHDGLLPSFKQPLLAIDYFLHFTLSLSKYFLSFLSFLLLRNDLSSENIFLLLQSLTFLVHRINQ